MANPNYPNDPGYRDPVDPLDPRKDTRYVRSETSTAFMPTWGWVALVIAAIVVFSLIFSWGDGTQQQAEIPNTPPAVSTTPPASSPATPPAQSPANPPAATPSNPPAPNNQ
jgi:hypothetical protein